MNLLVTPAGVYGIEHIIYLIIMAIVCALVFVLSKKYCKSEKSKTICVKVIALILFISICLNRYFIVFSGSDPKIIRLIPNSICGFCSFTFSLTVLLGKKDNLAMHFLGYLAIIGGLVTMAYPDFLETQGFWEPKSITGMLHHSLMFLLSIETMILGWFKPTFKKWYVFPLGGCILFTFGLFLLDGLGFSSAMQIHNPLLSSAPIFTSWYVVGALAFALSMGMIWIYQLVTKKK